MTTFTIYRYEEIDNGNSRWRYTFNHKQPVDTYGYDNYSGDVIGATVERGYLQEAGTITFPDDVKVILNPNYYGDIALFIEDRPCYTSGYTAEDIVIWKDIPKGCKLKLERD